MKKEVPEEDEDDIIDAGAIDDPEGAVGLFIWITMYLKGGFIPIGRTKGLTG